MGETISTVSKPSRVIDYYVLGIAVPHDSWIYQCHYSRVVDGVCEYTSNFIRHIGESTHRLTRWRGDNTHSPTTGLEEGDQH